MGLQIMFSFYTTIGYNICHGKIKAKNKLFNKQKKLGELKNDV
jgi:hypothetical protein